MNEIDVFDAVQDVEIAEIPVPGAWGIDLSPVGTTLYAGTTVGDIYEINTQTNQVTNRYLSSSIGSNGFAASEVFVMADGRLAIAGGVGSLDGLQSIGVWNPTTNALDTGAPSKNPFVPATVCPNIQNVGAFAVSGDRTRVLAATVDTGLEPICSYDPATQQATTGMFPQDTPLREIIPSPDGTRFTASYPGSATLQAGLYDPTRDLYYFADKSEIQVFSKTGGAWLTPITLPGTNTTTQLLAISESPDGSKLAVSDFGGQQIYVLDPDTPGSAESYPMSLDSGFGSWIAPAGLAITNSGVVYFATADIYGTGTPAFHKLVTSTRSITDVGRFQSGGIGDNLIRVLLSPDGSRVYSNIEGASFWTHLMTKYTIPPQPQVSLAVFTKWRSPLTAALLMPIRFLRTTR